MRKTSKKQYSMFLVRVVGVLLWIEHFPQSYSDRIGKDSCLISLGIDRVLTKVLEPHGSWSGGQLGKGWQGSGVLP